MNIPFIDKLKGAFHTLILLDYDGTLVDYAPMPERAVPNESLLKVLKKLSRKENTDVVIITGRIHTDTDKFFAHIPVTLIAEHGAMMKKNGKWEVLLRAGHQWKNKILILLNDAVLACPNSFVEEKNFSLSWHYRNAESGYAHSQKLISILRENVHPYNFKILDGNKVVEIIPQKIGKGKAVKKILSGKNYDCILAIGDDKTDEEMFGYLAKNKNAITIKVGQGKTSAKYKLDDVKDVIHLLKGLSLCD